ncbi:type I-B CRISPR-associated protein Cas8b1/Cst1 [Rickettsiales bacterium]|nr:type I-B CRISPR-associated protein Cas8b1/Cst1 [Rickettsiales bacterium]
MVEIGKTSILPVIRQVDFGYYLDGDDLGEILIPKRYVPEKCKEGDELEVFIYLDSEDRLIATTEIPYVEVGKSAHLKVVSEGKFGAFLDWGLPKDLLVPFKEQRVPMLAGKSYTVFLYIDSTNRIAASSRLSSFLKEYDDENKFIEEQQVTLQIVSRSNIGYKAIINDTHLGVIHNNCILQPIEIGQTIDGYIKKIRKDGLIDLTLIAAGQEATNSLTDNILEFIKAEGGSTNLTDKSSPEDIFMAFNISKSRYKKALGKLYKERKIIIDKDLITLL